MQKSVIKHIAAIGFMLSAPVGVICAKPTFKVVKQYEATSVKNQWRTSTCWSFATIAMLESELLAQGKENVNLSEMFVVRKIYELKAERYIRMHGYIKFTGGGSLNDALEITDKYGLMPESAYSGLPEGNNNHNHWQMDSVLHNYVDSVVNQLAAHKNLKTNWHIRFNAIIDNYLGQLPESFNFEGKTHTAKSFAQWLNINTHNYVLISSFTNKEMYKPFVVEVPDNWSWGNAYNVTLPELTAIADYSLANGHTLAMACDVTEPGFVWPEGIAQVKAEKTDTAEPLITPELRQFAFDNYQTTDDHAMQITGWANSETGKKFYIVKNSWGTSNTCYNGYMYVSEPYFQYKSICLLINKNTIPKELAQKLFNQQ